MIAPLFTRLGWTRDDAKWIVGMIVAIVVGLAALSESTITDLGLPQVLVPALPYFRLAALIVGIVSGKMATSGLPAKRDPITGAIVKDGL